MTGSGPLIPPLSVLVVDDHAVFADALAFALSTDPVFDRVGTSGDAAGAVAAMEDEPYALLVVDVDLGTAHGDGEDGIALAARLLARWPASRAVVLTAHPLPQVVRRATAAGAVGVLAKGAGLDEVTAALLVAAGRSDVAAPFVAAGADDEGASLTTREVEVLQLLTDGLDVRAVARHLDLSVHTVRDHVKSAREKLGVHTQLDAVVAAVRLGAVRLLDPGRGADVRR